MLEDASSIRRVVLASGLSGIIKSKENTIKFLRDCAY